jgi:hypothetical protein
MRVACRGWRVERAAVGVMLFAAGCAGARENPADTTGLTTGARADTSALAAPSAAETVATPPPVAGASSAASAAKPSAPPRRPGAASTPSRPSSPPPSTLNPPPSTMDSARGVAAVVGSIPVTRVIVRPASGRPITVTGPLAREIGVASGADVWVRGPRAADGSIEATSYSVRSVDGVPAITGTLAAEGDRLVLVSDDGRRHPLARPPAPLRQQVGARVWITGDPAGAIGSFGILRPNR